ncbi:MAG: hypothetical protein EA384_06765 [Spirochaetaceae bacterium]|nr:MAG: hypothetical protein EA384_06765 [Spirochaetaceae bacterium]
MSRASSRVRCAVCPSVRYSSSVAE